MNIKEVRELTAAELDEKISSLRQRRFELTRSKAVGQLEHPEEIASIRKDLARLLTVSCFATQRFNMLMIFQLCRDPSREKKRLISSWKSTTTPKAPTLIKRSMMPPKSSILNTNDTRNQIMTNVRMPMKIFIAPVFFNSLYA